MAAILGLDAVLSFGAANATATTVMANVENVGLSLERDEADVSTRGAGGWEEVIATLRKGTLEFTMIYDNDDAAFQAVQEAFFNDVQTPVAFTVYDDAGHGLDADFTILNFKVDQPLKEGVKVDVTAKPTRSLRAPVWVS